MDPELRACLDRLDSNANERAAAADAKSNERAAAADAKSNSILKALDAQTERIDALVAWRLELEARFAKLELSVAALQAASPAAATLVDRRCRLPSSRRPATSTGTLATARRISPEDPRR